MKAVMQELSEGTNLGRMQLIQTLNLPLD